MRKKNTEIILRAVGLAIIRSLQVVSRPAVIYNLSILFAVSSVGTGVTMLAGIPWGLITLGSIVGVITITNLWIATRGPR